MFNTLSALSGREMAFYLDLRETEVVALLGELDDIFQVRQTARSGYGKVVNIANRLCRAFGGGTFSFAVRDRSAYVPAPPEVSRGGDLLPPVLAGEEKDRGCPALRQMRPGGLKPPRRPRPSRP